MFGCVSHGRGFVHLVFRAESGILPDGECDVQGIGQARQLRVSCAHGVEVGECESGSAKLGSDPGTVGRRIQESRLKESRTGLRQEQLASASCPAGDGECAIIRG